MSRSCSFSLFVTIYIIVNNLKILTWVVYNIRFNITCKILLVCSQSGPIISPCALAHMRIGTQNWSPIMNQRHHYVNLSLKSDLSLPMTNTIWYSTSLVKSSYIWWKYLYGIQLTLLLSDHSLLSTGLRMINAPCHSTNVHASVRYTVNPPTVWPFNIFHYGNEW